MLLVGEMAPDIDAVTTLGDRFVLSAQTSICSVVYFFPKAFTPGCTKETRLFVENYNELLLAGATIIGVSTDDGETQCEFAQSLGTPFALIGDSDKSISKAYGVLRGMLGVAKRVTFVLSVEKRVLAVFHHDFAIDKHRDDVLPFVHDYCDEVRRQSQGLWSQALAASQAKVQAHKS